MGMKEARTGQIDRIYLSHTGKYLVAIAVTTVIPWTSSSIELADYVVPSAAEYGIDDEVVEAGSRVSLRCPISHKRIKTPVKGVNCRHHQCFDFDSYIEMNELRPVWRCPYCNSNLNCLQVRLDRKMKQILMDVDEKYFEAIVKEDGSWVPGQSSDEPKEINARCADGADPSQLSGADVMLSDISIIDLSDDEEINEPVLSVEKIVSPRGQPVVSSGNATSSSLDGREDRKPVIGGICGTSISQSPVTCASTRDRVDTSSGYAVLNEASLQAGLSINHSRGLPDSNAGVRHLQSSAPTTHMWSGGNGSMYVPTQPPSVQQPGSRVPSLDRHTFPAAGVQALPLTNQALGQRARVGSLPQSVMSGVQSNAGFLTSTSQIQSSLTPPVQLGPEQVFQRDILYQQQSQDLYRQMQLNSNAFRAPVEMDASQRNQRRGPRNGVGLQQGTVPNDQGLAREVQTQQFGSASPSLAEQRQYNLTGSIIGHNLNNSRQEYWQPQRLTPQQYQQYQQLQAHLNQPNARASPGVRSPPFNAVPFTSPPAVPTGVLQQVATSRHSPRVVNTGSVSTSTTPVVTGSNTTGVAPPQVPNWRPAGRMRGSVSGGFLVGNLVGVNSVAPQPGPGNRMRVSGAPNTTSLPLSNSLNLPSLNPLSANLTPSPLLVPNVPSVEGARATAYNASRLPSDEFSVSDAFFNSSGLMTTGEMLQDVVWVPVLGPDLGDNIGTPEVDRWLDEAMFNPVSSQGL